MLGIPIGLVTVATAGTPVPLTLSLLTTAEQAQLPPGSAVAPRLKFGRTRLRSALCMSRAAMAGFMLRCPLRRRARCTRGSRPRTTGITSRRFAAAPSTLTTASS